MRLHPSAAAAAAVFAWAAVAAAQDGDFIPMMPEIPTIWDLELGAHALELPAHAYADYACGTNGGPPALFVGGFADYAMCALEEESGLHEVAFRYDDDIEYWALAHNLPLRAQRFKATTAYDMPIVVSALFDEDGFLVGVRLVSDQRADVETRQRSVTLRTFLVGRYSGGTWDCVDLEPAEGERAFGNIFVKDRCTRVSEEERRRTIMEAHYYRRAGQVGIDPRTQRRVEGQFWSETRLEEFLVGSVVDREARLAVLADFVPQIPEIVLRARDCPGCDLAGAELKRADLRNANLAGANLAGANLHDAKLDGANLAGANLAGATLNKANLKRANLAGADLSRALLYEAHLDGVDASDANFDHAKMARISLINANLNRSVLTVVDMREGRLSNVRLNGADLTDSWLHVCQLRGADFTNATLVGTSFYSAELVRAVLDGADLTGADLRRSDLRQATFHASDLTGAHMSMALTREADFEGAVLPEGFTPPGGR